MNRRKTQSRRSILAMLVFAACAPPVAARAAPKPDGQSSSPERLVAAIYALYRVSAEKGGLGFSAGTKAELRRWMTPSLTELFWWGTTEEVPDEGMQAINFDVFVNGQDYDISTVALKTIPKTKASCTVEARFDNLGSAQVVYYDMTMLGSGWRIANIRYPRDEIFPSGFSLVRFIGEARKQAGLRPIG